MATGNCGQVCLNFPCSVRLFTPCSQASADETVQVSLDPDSMTGVKTKIPRPITHPKQVRCILPIGLTDVSEPYLITGSGDIIRAYDLSTFDEPEMIREVDAHWHDILALRLWIRRSVGDDGLVRVEPWVVSTSLDGTIRKWRLVGMGSVINRRPAQYSLSIHLELVTPLPPVKPELAEEIPASVADSESFQMTEDEERELAELLDGD